MNKFKTIAGACNALYLACGRQIPKGLIDAYEITLEDCTAYQIDQATRYLMKHHVGDFPPTAQQLREQALKYRPTAAAEAAKLRHNQEQLRVARQPRISNSPEAN